MILFPAVYPGIGRVKPFPYHLQFLRKYTVLYLIPADLVKTFPEIKPLYFRYFFLLKPESRFVPVQNKRIYIADLIVNEFPSVKILLLLLIPLKRNKLN